MSKNSVANAYTQTRRQLLTRTAMLAGGAIIAAAGSRVGSARADALDVMHVAVTGGSGDSLDPHRTQGQVSDIIRFTNLFDGLSEYRPDASVQLSLAESFTPNATADEWTLKLHPGVKLHDGRESGS